MTIAVKNANGKAAGNATATGLKMIRTAMPTATEIQTATEIPTEIEIRTEIQIPDICIRRFTTKGREISRNARK